MWIGILTMIGTLAGCGKMTDEVQDNEELQYMADDIGSQDEYETDVDAASLKYMEKVMIEDYYGDMAEYEMYAPIGSENEDGFLSYIDHGLMFSAMVYNDGSRAFLYEGLKMSIDFQKEDWENDSRYSDIQVGEVMENGDDRYVFFSARGEDYNGSAYDKNMVLYLDVRDDGVGIQWELEITEFDIDSETELIVDEIAQCYGISLDDLAVSGEWAEEDAKWEMERQDVYEPEEGEPVLTKADGYQYMGITTISLDDGTINCPVMLPMGWNTSIKEDRASVSMHGVHVYIRGYKTYSMNYLAEVEDDADSYYRYASDPDEDNRNVKRSEVATMAGYKEAVYYTVEYEEPDYKGEEYHSQADVYCYIRLKDKYLLRCDIRLSSEDYDGATNILLKELETAYGIDLSGCYYE